MTNTTIFAIIAMAGFIIFGLTYPNVLAVEEGGINSKEHKLMDSAKAIPDWVDNNFRWYGEGLIEQTDLLNSLSYLLDNGNIHLSDKAAQEMADLRGENAALKKKLDVDGIVGPNTATDDAGYKFNIKEHPTDDSDDYGKVKVQFHWDEETEQESLHHLRKAYDLNPAFQTKVVQFDSNHDKWIDVLSIDWGSSSSQEDCSAAEGVSDEKSSCWIRVSQVHAGEEIWTDEYGATSSSGDPDRPLITGQVYNSETTDDRPTEEVAFYYNKIASASETVHDLVNNGETSTDAWKNEIMHGTSSTDGIHELGHALGVFCTVAMDNEVQRHETDLEFLKELSDAVQEDSETTTGATGTTARLTTGTTMTNIFQELALERAEKLEKKVDSLQVGMDICNAELKNLEDDLQTAGDDAQLANIDLQNMLQKHQQTMQMMSNMMKSQHDTLKAIIQNMRA